MILARTTARLAGRTLAVGIRGSARAPVRVASTKAAPTPVPRTLAAAFAAGGALVAGYVRAPTPSSAPAHPALARLRVRAPGRARRRLDEGGRAARGISSEFRSRRLSPPTPFRLGFVLYITYCSTPEGPSN